jgi:hypothetical protein
LAIQQEPSEHRKRIEQRRRHAHLGIVCGHPGDISPDVPGRRSQSSTKSTGANVDASAIDRSVRFLSEP